MIEIRRRHSWRFRTIIPAPQLHGVTRVRRSHETGRLIAIVPAALHFKAVPGFGRKDVPVAGVGMAKITLGLDVQPDRFEHSGPEQSAQIPLRAMLMQIVIPVFFQQRGLLSGSVPVFMTVTRSKIFDSPPQNARRRLVSDHVADIVQKTGSYQFRIAIRLLGKVGALQGVFKLTDSFAAILPGAPVAVERNDFINGRNDHDKRFR